MSDDHKRLNQSQFGQHASAYVTSSTHAKGYSLGRLIELSDPQPDWRVLDIATGGGHTALAFTHHAEEVVATDLTHPMILAAREHIDANRGRARVSYSQCDAENFPFPDESFDCVTCRIAPHHFPDVARFVEEAARVLKPGGVFALADNVVSGEPDIANYVNAFEKLRDTSHYWAHTVDDWVTYCFMANLKVTHTETFLKEVGFDKWATRLGISADDLMRLRVMLLHAPDVVKEWMQPHLEGNRQLFMITEAVVIATKK